MGWAGLGYAPAFDGLGWAGLRTQGGFTLFVNLQKLYSKDAFALQVAAEHRSIFHTLNYIV
jgi:hypothetical protein